MKVFLFILSLITWFSPSLAISCYDCIDCPNSTPSMRSGCKSCFAGYEGSSFNRFCLLTYHNYCGNFIINSKDSWGCTCNENLCNKGDDTKIKCSQCMECSEPYNQHIKICPPGASGCFNKYVNDKLYSMECSSNSPRTILYNGKLGFDYCNGDSCNIPVKNFLFYNQKINSGKVCYFCENCENKPEVIHCPNTDACFSGTRNGMLKKTCVKTSKPDFCGEILADGLKYEGCMCSDDLCNYDEIITITNTTTTTITTTITTTTTTTKTTTTTTTTSTTKTVEIESSGLSVFSNFLVLFSIVLFNVL